MLNQVPGFSIRENDTVRGLGQATGNVLFNGARPSTKSDTIVTQLTRISAADVERIEIVDGASLDIPGLSGQVANIVFRADGFSGQFSRSEEHTSELQSLMRLSYAVFCLKKKTHIPHSHTYHHITH